MSTNSERESANAIARRALAAAERWLAEKAARERLERVESWIKKQEHQKEESHDK
jgi:hypothetical protein